MIGIRKIDDWIFGYFGVVAFVGLFISCNQLEEFSTKEDEVYRGEIVDARFIILSPQINQSIFKVGTKVELVIDFLAAENEVAGYITTDDGLFNRSPLNLFLPIVYDKLSLMELPNSFRSFIYFVEPSDPEFGEIDAIAIVSIMDNKEVELRIILAGGERRRSFALFRLRKEKR